MQYACRLQLHQALCIPREDPRASRQLFMAAVSQTLPQLCINVAVAAGNWCSANVLVSSMMDSTIISAQQQSCLHIHGLDIVYLCMHMHVPTDLIRQHQNWTSRDANCRFYYMSGGTALHSYQEHSLSTSMSKGKLTPCMSIRSAMQAKTVT